MYGGQSSEGFLVDHHLLLSKQRNDTELKAGLNLKNATFYNDF